MVRAELGLLAQVRAAGRSWHAPSAAQKSSGPVNSFFSRFSGLMIWNCLYDRPRLTSMSYTLRGSTILLPCVTSFQSVRRSRLATEAMLYVAKRLDQAGLFRERGCSPVVVTAAAPATASSSSGRWRPPERGCGTDSSCLRACPAQRSRLAWSLVVSEYGSEPTARQGELVTWLPGEKRAEQRTDCLVLGSL